ncbi:TlpA disulfide reductase family protein [Deltaproteobacteria bacterium TL4]
MTSLQVGRLLIPVLIYFLTSCTPPQRGVKEGERVPELAVIDLQGTAIKLAKAEGKVALLSFWINGCSSCVEEMGHLERVHQKYQSQGLEVWGINIGGDVESVEAFAQKLHLSFPMLMDSLQITAEKYQVNAVPTVLLLDRQGRLKRKITGAFSLRMLEKELQLAGFY